MDNLEPPQESEEFLELLDLANEYLIEQQDICQNTYGLGGYENWFYEQETGLLTFSDNQELKLKIKYEEVGTISKVTNTWLWSWANPHLLPKVKSEIIKIKEFGEKQHFGKLIKSKWYAEETDGWEMTAIAAYLMKAKGCYRAPTDSTFSFMIFKEIEDLR